ncbi:hypothetical protein [Endozoicomonas sp. YOMI1]|uniref:hypothetical protein n=1 Tax=Endozoicomonas sp. YOMI1 TaxID=2828739 RepID=UPI0021475791|nr:hypothetical protein [Endozoicomonas sp. YOMI1]
MNSWIEIIVRRLKFYLRELITSKGQYVIDDEYHIQNVNAYPSDFKAWINGFFNFLYWREAFYMELLFILFSPGCFNHLRRRLFYDECPCLFPLPRIHRYFRVIQW